MADSWCLSCGYRPGTMPIVGECKVPEQHWPIEDSFHFDEVYFAIPIRDIHEANK